jgi:hypothetical protein
MKRFIQIMVLMFCMNISAQIGKVGVSIYKNINQVEFIYLKAYGNILDVAKMKAEEITDRPEIQLYYEIADEQCYYFLQWVRIKDLSTTDKRKMDNAIAMGGVNCNGLMRFDFKKIMTVYNQ